MERVIKAELIPNAEWHRQIWAGDDWVLFVDAGGFKQAAMCMTANELFVVVPDPAKFKEAEIKWLFSQK